MSKSQTTKAASTKTEEVKTPKEKLPKTVLENGLTYSLCSRLLNALPYAKKTELQSVAKNQVKMVDGRGAEKTIPSVIVDMAGKLGAKFLASTRSSYLKPRLDINWSAGTISLKELEKPEPKAKKEDTSSAKALAKSTKKSAKAS